MFYLKYLFAEIIRRFSKTLTIVTGLAISSAIIIMIISFSQALSSSQANVLNPLQNVGTDIMLTRSVDSENIRNMDSATRDEYRSDNRVQMNLSKLGNPGSKFSTDQFLPGSLLTYDSATTKKLDKNTIANYAQGLIMNINHMEGIVPKVTSTFKTGGEKIQVGGSISRDSMRQAFQQARKNAQAAVRAKGIDPNSEQGRDMVNEEIMNYMPAPDFRTEITTPRKSITQDVGPISTDIKTETLTVSGVDTTKKDIGLILPNQIIQGKYFTGAANEIIINKSYADKNTKKIGDFITLSNVKYNVVGIVDPKLYTNSTDFYLPLTVLQKIATKTNRINILLVKTTNANNVKAVSKTLTTLVSGAKVINSKDTADKVSGSLVQASSLTNKFIGITSLIILVAAFIIVVLLTVSSINKRTREIGTLKAIGWSNLEVIRQIVLENIVLGILGAIVGMALGIGAILLLNHYNISLNATVQSMNSANGGIFGRFGGGRNESAQAAAIETSIQLKVAISFLVLALGGLVSIIGSLITGFFAALKVSRLKPQVALRNLE